MMKKTMSGWYKYILLLSIIHSAFLLIGAESSCSQFLRQFQLRWQQGEDEKDMHYDPLLVVVLMVKNEETVMRATLQPFIDAGIHSYLIFDTGSTDDTIEVTRDLFDEYGVTEGYIIQEPFIDFATSRNRALDLAERLFPYAAFMVMLDAEWYISDAPALLSFCQTCLDREDIYTSYLMLVKTDTFENYTSRLLRCRRGLRFGGSVHETITHPTHIRVPDSIAFSYLPGRIGIEKTLTRFTRDCQLLLVEHEEKPWCSRTLFYLARAYECVGDYVTAYDFYKERLKLIGWDEEDFMARLRLGLTIKNLVFHEQNPDYEWSEALSYFLQAYQLRPHRAEPLIEIADYYVQIGQMDTAFLFALPAAHIPYPSQDMLFIEKYLYNYYRYELLARCAWYISEFEVGEWAARKAYAAYPDYEYAQINMNCYLSLKGESL
jgi:glycosyltransferase involved in cell wall biosynthesis